MSIGSLNNLLQKRGNVVIATENFVLTVTCNYWSYHKIL